MIIIHEKDELYLDDVVLQLELGPHDLMSAFTQLSTRQGVPSDTILLTLKTFFFHSLLLSRLDSRVYAP